MSEAQHMPGPWKVVADTRRLRRYRVESADGEAWVADAYQVRRGYFPEVEANARLIAAAPDLLAVLREMFVDGPVQVALAGNPIACDELERRARSAIAKAGGR